MSNAPHDANSAAPIRPRYRLLRVANIDVIHDADWQRIASIGCTPGDVLILMCPKGALGICTVAPPKATSAEPAATLRTAPPSEIENVLVLDTAIPDADLQGRGLLPKDHPYWLRGAADVSLLRPVVAARLVQAIRNQWEQEARWRSEKQGWNDAERTSNKRHLLLSISGFSLCGLLVIDSLQSWVSNVHNPQVRAAMRDSALRAEVRTCLQKFPLPTASNAVLAASAAPGVASSSPASSAQPATAKNPGAANTELNEQVRCEQSLQALDQASGKMGGTFLAFVEQAFREGSALNVALRLLKLVLLGLLALSAAELLLKLLKRWGLPMLSLEDLARSASQLKPERPEAVKREAAPSVGRDVPSLVSLIGTTVITGLTGAAVVVPEIAQQVVMTSRIAESKVLDMRSIQTQSSTDHSTHKEHFEKQVERERAADAQLEAVLANLGERALALNDRLLEINEQVRSTQRAVESLATAQTQAIVLSGQLAAASGRMESAVQSSIVAASAAQGTALAVREEQAKAFAAQQRWLEAQRLQLVSAVDAAASASREAKSDVASLSQSVKKRGCATLAYFEDVEKKRLVFTREAQERLQRLRNIMQLPEPTADCEGDSVTARAAP